MKELTKQEKRIVAKIALDLNIPAEKIANELGVHRTTVYRYSESPTPEEMQHFATEMRTMMEVKRQMLQAQIMKNLEEVIPTCASVRELAFAYGLLNKQENIGSNDKRTDDLRIEVKDYQTAN